MVNAKKKGNSWENKLANWLSDHGFRARKDGASGGTAREKGDIHNNEGFTIESKAYKQLALQEWWRQVTKSASLQGNSPLLFIHQDGMPDNEWMVVMHSEDWIDMWKKQKGEVEVKETLDPNLRWKIEKTVYALKELMKELVDR